MLIGQEEIQKEEGITSERVPGTYNYIDRLNRHVEKIWSKSWLRTGGNKTRIKQYSKKQNPREAKKYAINKRMNKK